MLGSTGRCRFALTGSAQSTTIELASTVFKIMRHQAREFLQLGDTGCREFQALFPGFERVKNSWIRSLRCIRIHIFPTLPSFSIRVLPKQRKVSNVQLWQEIADEYINIQV